MQRPKITTNRLLAAICLCLGLMVMDHRYGHLESTRTYLSGLVYPLQATFNVPLQYLDRLMEQLQARRAILEENDRLRRENLKVGASLQRYEAVAAENERLRELLESSYRIKEQVLLAEMVSIDLQAHSHRLVVNKGSREGVYVGQPVVDAHGVMGQVLHVGPFSSSVLMLTDPRHALPVSVTRTGLRAIATGTGRRDELQLEYLSSESDVRKNDLVVSSGLGDRFPAGYPVGKVARVEQGKDGSSPRIIVTPSAQVEYSVEFLLVDPRDRI